MKIINYKIYSSFMFAMLFSLTEAYRILGVLPFKANSHNMIFSEIVKGLLNHNHEVDVITHFPMKNPPLNYKVVVSLNETTKRNTEVGTLDLIQELSTNFVYYAANFYGNNICKLLGSEEIQKFIKNPPKYDLIIVELFGANCFLGLGHFFKVPIIGITTTIEYPWISDFIKNPDNLAFIPSTALTKFDKTKFWDRLYNVYSHYYNVYKFYSYTENIQTDLMRKYLSPDIPNIREVEKSIALTLVNKHHAIHESYPVNPSVIQISGLHIMEKSELKLPSYLKKWLDESVNGVVYFTFGSWVLIETLQIDTLNAIYKAIEKIAPIRVLMKIVDKNKLPPGLPENVFISAWIPQQAVLAHKNIRLFITHGGMLSSQEALYYGVPMIGVPLFADQARNVGSFVAKNMAIQINFDNLTAESLDEALDLIINKPMYRENAQLYSRAFKDKPIKAIDSAMFWIEFVARNGPNILRSPGINLEWWQLALLDVYGFILLCVVVTAIVIFFLIKFVIKQIVHLRCKNLKIE